MEPTILTPSDDPLTQIRHTLEGIRTNQADALAELGTKVSTILPKLEQYEARLIEMEDKGRNPYNRFWQSSHATREERHEVVSRWVQDAYRSTDPQWATSPSGITASALGHPMALCAIGVILIPFLIPKTFLCHPSICGHSFNSRNNLMNVTWCNCKYYRDLRGRQSHAGPQNINKIVAITEGIFPIKPDKI